MFSKYDRAARWVARIGYAEGVREAVISGMGITVASEWMFSPEIASGRVVHALPDWALPKIDVSAVFPTGRNVSAKARAFANFIELELGSNFSDGNESGDEALAVGLIAGRS